MNAQMKLYKQPAETQKKQRKPLELHDDGSGSHIRYGIRGNKYEFYEHGKKICTVDRGTWDRLMGDGVLPSEIPAMMCRKVERGARSSFRSQEIIGYDDYEGHRMIRGDSGEIY